MGSRPFGFFPNLESLRQAFLGPAGHGAHNLRCLLAGGLDTTPFCCDIELRLITTGFVIGLMVCAGDAKGGLRPTTKTGPRFRRSPLHVPPSGQTASPAPHKKNSSLA